MPLVCTCLGSGLLGQVWGERAQICSPEKSSDILKKNWRIGDSRAPSSTAFRSLHLSVFIYKSEFPSKIFWWPSSFSYQFSFPGFPHPLRHQTVGQWLLITVSFCLIHHSFHWVQPVPSCSTVRRRELPSTAPALPAALPSHGRVVHHGNRPPKEKIEELEHIFWSWQDLISRAHRQKLCQRDFNKAIQMYPLLRTQVSRKPGFL